MLIGMALRDKNLVFMLSSVLLALRKTLLAIHRTTCAGLERDFTFFIAV